MLSDNISNIAIVDLEQLISDSVPEGKKIDYKVALSGGSDSEKKEFLADVSSFANTQGGHLVYGMKERGGFPTNLVPMAVNDVDAEIRRMDSLIQSGIDPRIKYEIKAISHDAGTIIVIHVFQSWYPPHRVVFKGHDKFYARNSAGKYPLDISELRDIFNLSMTMFEKVEKRLAHRREIISQSNYPIPSDYSESRFSLHLIPLDLQSNSDRPDIHKVYRSEDLYPIDYWGCNFNTNFEGFIQYSSEEDRKIYTYLQMHRDSMIEAVNARFVTASRDFAYQLFEKETVKALSRYLNAYRDLGISTPIVGALSLYSVEGTVLRNTIHNSSPLREKNLLLPHFLIEDYTVPVEKILLSSFDIVWNAYGFERCMDFDKDGNFLLKA